MSILCASSKATECIALVLILQTPPSQNYRLLSEALLIFHVNDREVTFDNVVC